MVFDCFVFFNEVELLELRLRELWDVVDRFVIVESTLTHANKPKPLYYQVNRSRFERYQAKIEYVLVEDMPDGADNWARENHQRNCIARGLTGCRPEDTVLISDVDEIPNAEVVGRCSQFSAPCSFQQEYCCFFLNFRGGKWNGTTLCRFKDLAGKSVQYWRDRRDQLPRVANGGWHYTYLGGAQRVITKLEAYAHQEYNNKSIKDGRLIQYAMITGRDLLGRGMTFEVMQPDLLPRTVQANPEFYKPLMALRTEEKPGLYGTACPERQKRRMKKLAGSVRHLHGVIVDMGCGDGPFTVPIANEVFPADVFAVDTWGGHHQASVGHASPEGGARCDSLPQFACNIRHMTRNNVFPFIMTSADFLHKLNNPVKFCRIEASPDEACMCAEIRGVVRLLVDGGVLCGELRGGAGQSLRELLRGVKVEDDFWYWRKPCGWGVKTWVRLLLAYLPAVAMRTRIGRWILPRTYAVSASEALQLMG
ncbi:MAG: hypothetical protein WCL44_00410 [bacterium]